MKRDNPIFIILLTLIIGCMILLAFVGCKTTQPIATHTDSVRVEIRHDSVYVYQHDSIFRDRWRSGDTVYVTIEKWQTRYKDKFVEIHDTIATSRTDTIAVSIESKGSAFWKGSGIAFWILLGVLVLGVAIGIIIKIAKR